MRILIAPDKFKGTLTGVEAAAAMSEGALRVYPDAVVTTLPVADGGEGTLEAAVAAGFEEHMNAVVGPIIKPVGAAWAIHQDTHVAVIETAQASGYLLSEPTVENALRAHSYGSGQLIAAALEAGATEIIIGLGGSAMTDAGSGALRALGLKLLDAHGNLVPLGGGSLLDVATINASGLDPRLAGTKIRMAVDVDNPLYGYNGAAHVFGPQKGADADAVEKLDAGLRHLASLVRAATGVDIDVPGAGAAGGFPSLFTAYANATIERGFDLVAEMVGLDAALNGADLVITGEGSMDEQSLSGKAPIGVADAAHARGLPVVVVAGRITVTAQELAAHGVVAAVSATDVAGSPEAALAEAAMHTARATSEALNGI
ncbi:glycerate kinase [Arthrobacter livingstonensis]|uniref:Glycerate kinase n=1 Tax=Arthrobacter livingstonensis TaxID=670078 RepID=A0A2V5LX86_9MICC|nr:glycerate kinase [Arthrobacter livingstonensis]PYI66916.1 glycerate kinase [Arthrobacter livingstonensis]